MAASIGRAPGSLATLQAFVNTLDIEAGTDALATPAGLDSWLFEAALTDGRGRPAGPRDLAMAIELRDALRRVLGSHVAHPGARATRATGAIRATGATRAAEADIGAGPAPAARVARIAASMHAGIDADADGRIVVVASGQAARAGLTRLLLIGAEAATAGTWTRLKVCSADDCQWSFYDRSPTRSGCWCSMQICGSRAKSRAYRSRAALPG